MGDTGASEQKESKVACAAEDNRVGRVCWNTSGDMQRVECWKEDSQQICLVAVPCWEAQAVFA